MLSQKNENPWIYAGMLSYLKAFPGEETENILLSALKKSDSPVIAEQACKILLWVGSSTTLRVIDKIKKPDPYLQFVHIVLSHKQGIASKFFREPDEKKILVPSGLTTSFGSKALTSEVHKRITRDLEKIFQTGNYASGGSEIICPHDHLAILPYEFVMASGISDTLRTRPSILGIIARENEEHKTWSQSRLILGGSSKKDRFYVAIYRMDGVMDMFGTGNVNERSLDLHSIIHPGKIAMTAKFYWHANTFTISGISNVTRLKALVPGKRLVKESGE
jgi:hypothetical protein